MSPEVFPIAPGGSTARWFCGLIGLLPLCLGLLLGSYSLFGSRLVGLELSGESLRIHGDVYGRTIPRTALKVAEARPLDRGAEPAYAPVRRTNGVGLPNYQSGWFGLAGGSKGLLFVTDWNRAVLVPTTDGYDLIVSPSDPRAFLEALRQPAPARTGFAMSTAAPLVSSPASWLFLGLTTLFPLAISGLLVYIAYSTRAVRFELSGESLRIRGDLFGRTIPRGSLRIGEAEVVDLRHDPDRRPVLRTCGVGLPGYLSGWFRLKDRSKGLAFLTDRSRAVALPTTDGYTLLISPAEPERFVRALRR